MMTMRQGWFWVVRFNGRVDEDQLRSWIRTFKAGNRGQGPTDIGLNRKHVHAWLEFCLKQRRGQVLESELQDHREATPLIISGGRVVSIDSVPILPNGIMLLRRRIRR